MPNMFCLLFVEHNLSQKNEWQQLKAKINDDDDDDDDSEIIPTKEKKKIREFLEKSKQINGTKNRKITW